MGYQPFLIAAPKVGLERDLEPWLLPNDAFPTLEDCYLFRGRIKKKEGYRLLDRLNFVAATVPAGPNVTTISFTIPGVSVGTPLTPKQTSFVWGTVSFVDDGANHFIQTDGLNTSTINYTTGAVTLNVVTSLPAGTDVIYYPGLPVMGLPTLQNTITIDAGTSNKEILMAFDTKFAYLFNGTTLTFVGENVYKTSGMPINWTGTDANFFWTTNYFAALWATNFVPGFQNNPTQTTANQGDGIRWFDQDQSGWVNFLPPLDGAKSTFLMGALMLFPYKGRLLALNTWEGTSYATRKNFPQRARWSQIGTPFAPSGAPVPSGSGAIAVDQAWFSDAGNPGFGGFFDAPTLEMIVSAQFVKDTLIVFFESSTWQLRYTGNELLPFAWEKINTELGASSTFSEVPFDKVVIGIGDVGIHACDSVNVERIDQRIPNEVFAIQNSDKGRARVAGIRDYYNQLVYWSIPYIGDDPQQAQDDDVAPLPPSGIPITYPNKILAYNYIDQSYSFFNDSFTAFGYYSKADGDLIWSKAKDVWQEAEFVWVPQSYQEAFPYVVGGNQQGFVEIFDPEIVLNDNSLLISNVSGSGTTFTITSLNHNLTNGQIIRIINNSTDLGFFTVFSVTDADTFVAKAPATVTFTFTGNAFIKLVRNINIITKRFNPFINEGSQVRLGHVDFYFDATTNGQIELDVYLNEDPTLPTNRLSVATSPESTYTRAPDLLPYAQQKLWKRVYVENISQLFQLQLTLNKSMLTNLNVVESDIVLHGLILWFAKSGRLIDV